MSKADESPAHEPHRPAFKIIQAPEKPSPLPMDESDRELLRDRERRKQATEPEPPAGGVKKGGKR